MESHKVYKLKLGLFGMLNYSYIIVDKRSNHAIIIDPSWDLERVTNKLQELNVELKGILLTHSHYDHTNLVNPLLDRFNPQVYMGCDEIEYYSFKCRNLNDVKDLDIIRFGDTDIKCIFTPGHTVGSMCYLLSDSMFTGDTIFIEGCGICSGNGGDPEKMFESVQRVKKIVNPYVRIYPGHSFGKKPGYFLSYLLDNNLYFNIREKKRFVDFRMRKNQKGIFDFK